MKDINIYISEALFKKPVSQKIEYTCKPENKQELRRIMEEHIKKEGSDCDLNDIDVSEIIDMSNLFNRYTFKYQNTFNCDISQWDVSNVKDMDFMFSGCVSFNRDISNWNVSNVIHMEDMFYNCTEFNQNLSDWNISNVKDPGDMFEGCPIKDEYKPKFKK